MEVNLHARQSGVTMKWYHRLVKALVDGTIVYVPGIDTDRKDQILEMLKKGFGIEAIAVEMFYTTPLRVVLSWPETFDGFSGGEVKSQGYKLFIMEQYRLTESGKYGVKGLMLSHTQYIAIPFYDRSLVEKIRIDEKGTPQGFEYTATIEVNGYTHRYCFYDIDECAAFALVTEEYTGQATALSLEKGTVTTTKGHGYTVTINKSTQQIED